jgi:FkbM family methyltransferase
MKFNYIYKKFKDIGFLLFFIKAMSVLLSKIEEKIISRKLSPHKNKDYEIEVNDINFKMSFSDYKIKGAILERIKGVREIDTTTLIKSILRSGDRVLEIGGCYGYFTMLMAWCVGDKGKVLSIEGLPRNFDILSSNISKNNFDNISCHNFFVGSEGTKIKFPKEANHPYEGINNYKNNISLDDNFDEINCININNFLYEKNFFPTHIFMDIEGFEVNAIEQLSEKFLIDYSPTLVFEDHSQFYTKEKNLAYLRDKLHKLGYETRKIYGNILCFKN